MYTKGDILEVPTGWDIEILDPDGDVIVTLNYIMTPGELWRPYVEEILRSNPATHKVFVLTIDGYTQIPNKEFEL